MIAKPTTATTKELPQVSRRNNESPYSAVQRFALIAISDRIACDTKAVEKLSTIKVIECNKEEDSTNE